MVIGGNGGTLHVVWVSLPSVGTSALAWSVRKERLRVRERTGIVLPNNISTTDDGLKQQSRQWY